MKKLKTVTWLRMQPEIAELLKMKMRLDLKLQLTSNFELISRLAADVQYDLNAFIESNGILNEKGDYMIPDKLMLNGEEQDNPASKKYGELQSELMEQEVELPVYLFNMSNFANLEAEKNFPFMYQLFKEYRGDFKINRQ